jgi:hypothetical protein
MCFGLHVKYPLFLSDFNRTWIFLTNFRKKNTQTSNFMKIRSLGAELFHADGQTDRHGGANSRFLEFCESALKKKTAVIPCTFCLLWSVQCVLFALGDVVAVCLSVCLSVCVLDNNKKLDSPFTKRPTSVLASAYCHGEDDRPILLPGRSIGFLHGAAPRPGRSHSAEWSLVCRHQVEWLCVRSAGFGAWCSDLMILYQLQSLFLKDLLYMSAFPWWRGENLAKSSESVSQSVSQAFSHISHSANLPFS